MKTTKQFQTDVTIKTVLPEDGNFVLGDVYERAAWPTEEAFKAFVSEWRAQGGVIKDKGPHYGKQIVKVIERRCFAI